MRIALALLLLITQAAQPPAELPAAAAAQLTTSIAAARGQEKNTWRDTPPLNPRGHVNGVVEIARDDRRKFEFDIAANAMRLDRTMSKTIGGYPVNYGFVPQTTSYDGDPFDVLVLGPPIASGTRVSGVIVGLMQMEDEKGLDSKVVISPVDGSGKPRYSLDAAARQRIETFFRGYKREEPGKFSRVPGWGNADDGLEFVRITHRFYCAAAGGC